MNIEDCYKLLELPVGASRKEVEDRYDELCSIYYPGSVEQLQKLSEFTRAYRIILQNFEKQKARQDKKLRFALQRKAVIGKLQKGISVHGGKLFLTGIAAVSVIVCATTINELSALFVERDIGASFTSIVQDANVIMGDVSSVAPIIDERLAMEDKPVPDNLEVPKDVTASGYTIENVDGVTYVDGHMIVNKTYSLPGSYVPTDTYVPVTKDSGVEFLDKEVTDAFKRMQNDAAQLGMSLRIVSGYRSYEYQSRLYDKYVRSDGEEAAQLYSALPGHSEHQTGLAFDLNSVSQSFAGTREGQWINENCYKYGFIIRYPEGKSEETGYIYEPWHLRYVGVELATELYNGGDWITIESHFGITSQYDFQDEVSKTIG